MAPQWKWKPECLHYHSHSSEQHLHPKTMSLFLLMPQTLSLNWWSNYAFPPPASWGRAIDLKLCEVKSHSMPSLFVFLHLQQTSTYYYPTGDFTPPLSPHPQEICMLGELWCKQDKTEPVFRLTLCSKHEEQNFDLGLLTVTVILWSQICVLTVFHTWMHT